MKSCDFLPRSSRILAEAVDPAIPGKTYPVQAGDTLEKLAKASDTTVSGLLYMNPDIPATGQITVGSKIKLPNLGEFAGIQTNAPATAAGSSANAATALKFFTQQGWSAAQAAGIVGNLQAESGKNINPAAVGDGGQAYGIAQWHPSRQKDFQAQMGRPIKGSSFQDQLEFIQWEFNNTEKAAGNKLKAAQSAAAAAEIMDKFYERSAGLHTDRRVANAVALAPSDTAVA